LVDTPQEDHLPEVRRHLAVGQAPLHHPCGEAADRKIKKLESKVNSLESKLNNIQSAIKALQNSKKGGGGGDSKDKKGGARKEKFKVLVSPNGVKAKMEHYSTNGKACCLFFNSTAGCSDKNCSFSHHCAACGDTKHGIMGHDD
jgi:hypothetical protein